MRSALVVPSNRPGSFLAFAGAWAASPARDWDELILVEDAPTRTFEAPPGVRHYARDDIEADLGVASWIVSRGDSACRCYGFLAAYRAGADIIATLDDDCYPDGRRPFIRSHVEAMEGQTRWVESIPGMRTRGLPYRNRGRARVVANMGLWSRVPDLDAIGTLAVGVVPDFDPPKGSRLMPSNQYWPLCGMNLAFRREATPLMYFPLMGEGSPYRRFDDIWCGVILQRIAAHLGLGIAAGEPIVRHLRASDPMANLVKEAPGIAANETFWEDVDGVPLTGRRPVGCMAQMGDRLAGSADPYLSRLGLALGEWASLF